MAASAGGTKELAESTMKNSWSLRVVWVGLMGWLAAGDAPLLGQAVDIPGPAFGIQQPATTPPSASAIDPSPQDGVLLLRNGEVLQGKIVRVGDFYYVAVANGQVRIRSADVETACRTLQEGYLFKRQNIRLPSAQEHLNLGQWCVRHGLVEEAQRELAEAVRLQPDHPLVPLLQRRIEIARQPALLPTASNLESPLKGDSSELESWVRTLPPVVVEQFTQSVQPILLNNCTAAGCHGPSEKNRFSLLKPPSGQSATRRLTQRNLANTFQWITPKDPLRSPLLTAPLGPHGSAKTPIFGNPQTESYQRLVRWVLLASGAGTAPEALVQGGVIGGTGRRHAGPPSPGMRPTASSAPISPRNPLSPPNPNEQPSPDAVVPAVAIEQRPQVVQQAGVWQPVPGATPSKGPLLEALAMPPNRSPQGDSVPPAFLPWAATPNAAAPPVDSSNGGPADSMNPPLGQPVVPDGSEATPPSFPSPVRPRFSPPYRSEPKRGDPRAGQFQPADPFDPELFNRRHPTAEPSP